MISCAGTVSSQSLPARFQQARSVCCEEEWACSQITQTAAEMSVQSSGFFPSQCYLSSKSDYQDHVSIIY